MRWIDINEMWIEIDESRFSSSKFRHYFFIKIFYYMILPSQFFIRKILLLWRAGSGIWSEYSFCYSIFLRFHKKNPTQRVVLYLIIIVQGCCQRIAQWKNHGYNAPYPLMKTWMFNLPGYCFGYIKRMFNNNFLIMGIDWKYASERYVQPSIHFK